MSPYLCVIQIKQPFLLQVCSACQYDCTACITELARHSFPTYSLSVPQVQKFIRAVEESDYFIKTVWLNGFGDPLLWAHLNEGAKLLAASDHIGEILVRSNGLAFEQMEQVTFDSIQLSLSLYGENTCSRSSPFSWVLRLGLQPVHGLAVNGATTLVGEPRAAALSRRLRPPPWPPRPRWCRSRGGRRQASSG